jgi:hypothetical protein
MSISTNTPFGLKPIRRFDGGIFGRVNGGYTIVDSYADTIGLGDPVVRVNGWQSNVNMGSAIINGPEINIGVSEGAILGSFDGCQYQDTQGNFIWSKQWVASTPTLNASGAQAFVYDDSQIVYQVQGGASWAADTVGEYAPIDSIGAPNALGVSTAYLGSATATLADGDVKVMNFVAAVASGGLGAGLGSNGPAAAYPLLEVLLVHPQNANATTQYST